MKIDYTVQIWKEDSQFVAHAMPIDVMSSAATIPAARIAVDEAVQLFLATSNDMGTLQEVLEECGYELTEGTWHAPECVATERHSTLVGV